MGRGGIADREPCPWRIVDDVGGAYSMGAVGGGIFHAIKGSWNAPRGGKFMGSMTGMQARGPVLGGQFAVWGGLFACCDCSLTAIRQKEDPWNSIVSGAATGGILAARAGPRVMAQSALVGGVLLALIEGMSIMFTRMASPALPTPDELAAGTPDVTAPPTTGGLLMPSSNAPQQQQSSSSSSYLPPFLEPSSSSSSDSFDGSGMGDTDTKFSSGNNIGSSSAENGGTSSGWWPFGSKA